MENGIRTEYVQGYNDAVETTHKAITSAVQRSVNPVNILDEIISNMYRQQDEAKALVNLIEKQVDESPEDWEYKPQDIISDLLDNAEDVAFTLTINGKFGGK